MKKNIKIFTIILSLIMLFSLSCCKENDHEEQSSGTSSESVLPEGVAIEISKSAITLTEDEMVVLTATANNGKAVNWDSDNPTVAIVSSTGKVIAKQVGSATITAAIGSATASCVVTVIAAKEKSNDYIVAESSIYMSMQTQQTEKIHATYMSVNKEGTAVVATGKNFVYTSLNPSIAVVSADGIITPIGVGTTDILVRCDDVETYVLIDVYSRLISTADEWNEMLRESDMFARYYVTQDIDFSQTAYNAYEGGTGKGFTGELNGGYHTLNNITVEGTDGPQSLLGGVITATVKNIAFTNVKFTAMAASGICDSVLQHRNVSEFENCQIAGDTVTINGKEILGAFKAPEMDVIMFPTYFINILLDASFVGHGNVGFCKDFYGGSLDCVYINMKRGDTAMFTQSDYALCRNLYIWNAPNSVNNVVIRYSGGEISTTMERLLGSHSLPTNNIFIGTNMMEANYIAHQTFSSAVWTIEPTGIPVFEK